MFIGDLNNIHPDSREIGVKVQVSLELNVIKTNWLFSTGRRQQSDWLRHKIVTQLDWKYQKRGHHHGTSLPCQSVGAHSPLPPPCVDTWVSGSMSLDST